MDDPWGSPWAEPTLKPTTAAPEPPSSLLSPPPKAFFGATSPGASPWGDDAGDFGEWAGPNSNKHDDSPASADWGAWGETSPTRLAPTSQLDHIGKASPVAWPSSAVPSPRLSPLPRSRASSTRRPSGTDPWVAELSQNLAKVDSRVLLVPETEQNPHAPRGYHTPPESKSVSQDGTRLEQDEEGRILNTSTDPNDAIPADAPVETTPRSSFAASMDSACDTARQDSPTTPLDEGLKGQVNSDAKSASGKVQELVGMFDSLARSASVEPEQRDSRAQGEVEHDAGCASSHNTPVVLSVSDQAARDGEDDHLQGRVVDSRQSSSVQSEGLATPEASGIEQHAHDDQSSTFTETIPSQGHSDTIDGIINKYGPLTFEPNLGAFEQAYAKIVTPVVAVSEGVEPHDGIIKDSFGEITERKTWYRISRFGSMRKHDLGDDDSYTRVAWPVTRLHDDTITIVRRWMEEDSFVGKSMLGGSKRTSVFNWDSPAAPVDLSTIYARKSSIEATPSSNSSAARHTAQSSESSQVSAWAGKRHSRGPSQTDVPLSVAQQPTPAFGWSSTKPKATVSFAPPPPAPSPMPSVAIKTASQASRPAKSVVGVEPLVLVKPSPPGAKTAGDDEDDDDDWGDMVASPGIENNTPVQMNGAFMPPVPGPASTQPVIKPSVSFEPPRADVLGNEDFSLFDNQRSDSTGNSLIGASNLAGDIRPTQSKPIPALGSSLAMSTKPVLSSKAPNSPHGLPATSQASTMRQAPTTSNADSEEESRIAKTIVDNLPDLSYMLGS
ncbi:uncharacterized protein B0I36DRAFT_362223 [Microdochium trichocladiopsis]|uniref:Uncharacterized protein n=1 Tax=Microdochium trichocladiopsis TaxID=1682393 RepID=A0A9P8Y9Q8_9PEZI|nr:uncharacterized protein B0I36DRAFT_362223 [Microdochium trichocladiopsis]KAH7033573.1 hypothetical protein B0I36DRAFT_362223 [Microdochium trichocladiopsis]